MKIFNKYTYLFLGLLIVAAIVVINFIPDLETEDFDQEVIDNIIEGVTTTTEPLQNQENWCPQRDLDSARLRQFR